MIHAKDFMMQYSQSNHGLEIDDMQIKPGECVVVCGKSGCGKTSFLRLLNGLIPDYYSARLEGELTCNNFQIGQATVEEMSYKIASVFQNPATQFFNRCVLDELVFPCENQGVNPKEIDERLQNVCHHLKLEALLEKDLLTSSGGERQKVAFATAMMQTPQLLLLDEPTANLDQAGVLMIQKQITILKELGVTIIIAEHRLNFLADCADRYLYFENGLLKEQWNRTEFLDLTTKKRRKLGLRQSVLPELQTSTQNNKRAGEFLVKDITISYQNNKLAHIPEICFKRGSITGIIGRNGVGKTTFIHHLAGLTDSLTGEYYWCNKPVDKKDRLSKTALVLQETRLQLFADSVEKELLLGAKDLRLYDELVERFHLRKLLPQHPMTLSGGEQQRVVIANALLSSKEIIILDEPTSGLDYAQMIQVASVLKQVKDLGKIVIIVSHDEEFLELCCEQLYKIKS
ncbi:energy-coupling factor transport system ATP-binding protein [Granulicatella balaenopterae]|uniref:Energy-coupling factor transport system ATP-binding protein n=1 Tax=Granulicatella balaenopterae TaxID=137733 RepID=A0A1H9LBQ7_9LACT|nr:ABC transporter ATP-binding protein [Granulicatella balaenopterae]SER08423.1 energy-coupling factor transport system ATP-binding protein [Granulicatella balaenopterae]